MNYTSLEDCIKDLKTNGHLKIITKEVDPNLEIASIHLEEYKKSGPALLFTNVKGSKFPAVSNIFGTKERSEFIFRKSINRVKHLIDLKISPINAFKNPIKSLGNAFYALNSLPKKKFIS